VDAFPDLKPEDTGLQRSHGIPDGCAENAWIRRHATGGLAQVRARPGDDDILDPDVTERLRVRELLGHDRGNVQYLMPQLHQPAAGEVLKPAPPSPARLIWELRR